MEMLLFCGLQGAGKTSFYQRHFSTTHLRISLDMLRTRRRERAILSACLECGQRCVIDNTNPTAAERAVYIAAAREKHFAVIGYFFDVPLTVCLVRNGGRTGKARIKEAGLLAARAKLTTPDLAEGFGRIYAVNAKGEVTLIAESGDEVR